MRIFITVLITLAVIMVIGAIVIFTGVYNVSAEAGHLGVTRWALATMTDASIESHGGDIVAPELTDEMATRGAGAFDAMCAMCHGAPGVARAEFAQGLLPLAPDLSEEAEEFSAGEIFWTVKNGIKFTGMPAFAPTHDDEALWDVVAFVERLPGMTAEGYEQMTVASGGHQHGEHDPSGGAHSEEASAEGGTHDESDIHQESETIHEHETTPQA